MRDISEKSTTLRTAQARARVRVSPLTIERIKLNQIPKGDPREVGKIAAIQAAKNTWQIIPLCHQIPIDFVGVDFELSEDAIEITTHVKAIHKTGVEMEALTAASIAALTVYDMLKFLDADLEIESVTLVNKTGGKSDFRKLPKRHLRAAVLVMSDSIARGEGEDKSGKLAVERLVNEAIEVVEYKVIPDDEAEIIKAVRAFTDDQAIDLVVTSGGTGLGPRDNTPEALAKLIERDVPGITDAIRNYGQSRNLLAMMSRASVGLRKNTLIISLPGSKTAVHEGLNAIFPAVLHAFDMIAGESHAPSAL